MSTIHFFNPESEAELADGSPGYTPPRAARMIAEAGTLLPLWWAEPGDTVITPPAFRQQKKALKERLGLAGVQPSKPDRADPWGWSPRAAHFFEKRGVDDDLIPLVGIISALSRRTTAIKVRSLLGVDPGEEFYDIDDLRRYIAEADSRVIVKAPLSCSGRGIIDCLTTPEAIVIGRAQAIIRRQGSVVAEQALDRRLDFAALFEADGGDIRFAGWSAFRAGPSGNYEGNIVAPQAELAAKLRRAEPWIEPLRRALSEAIGNSYSGPLGVDMMFYGHDLDVMPCIEINLRRTMGFVARDLAERHGLRGLLRFDNHPDGPGVTLSASTTARFAVI